MRFPIRITITTAFSIFTIAAISIVALFNFFESKRSILDTANIRMSHAAEIAELEVNRLLNHAFSASRSIAILPASTFDPASPDHLESVLTTTLSNSPEIYSAYIAYPNGSFIQAINLLEADGSKRPVSENYPDKAVTAWRILLSDENRDERFEFWRFFDRNGDEIIDHAKYEIQQTTFDPRTREWHIVAQNQNSMFFSKAYIFNSLNEPGVTISFPLRHYPGATVGVDIPLSALTHLVDRLRPGNNGRIAIYDQDGDMIAHHDKSSVFHQITKGESLKIITVDKTSDVVLLNAKMKFEATGAQYINFISEGAEYIAYFRTIEQDSSTNWKVVSIAAVSDFTNQLITTLYNSLIISAIVLIFALAAVTVLSGWIATPVIRLRDMADRVTEMNLSPIETFNSPFDEIQSLRNSMERMRSALETFMRYVPRELVRDLILSGEKVEVGGVKRDVTLLFTDIEGFTTLTEKMSPEEVMSQTSEYFERLTFAIEANRGTVDKFIGDAIMAMWNAPSDDDQHINNACRGTLAALAVSEDLNEELKERGANIMRTRFGLHTGAALVGNMGARDRMQYTCLGPCVNLAARLEGLNKYYGTSILVSDAVRRKASSDFLFRRIDIVEAKGTTIPVTLYELIGERGEFVAFGLSKDQIKRASDYEQAFDFYLHQDFDHAVVILKKLRLDVPEDKVVESLLQRCLAYLETPPPSSWNGVTSFDKK